MTLPTHYGIGFEPLLTAGVLWILAILAAAILGLYLWRRGTAPLTRALTLLVLGLALIGPSKLSEQRTALPDVVAILVDRSESMQLSARSAGAEAALTAVKARLAQIAGLDVRISSFGDGPSGTALSAALDQVVADVPEDRIAGVIVIGDGRFSDGADAARPFPLHQVLIGDKGERDRKLLIRSAPKTAPIGEMARVIIRVEDNGANVETDKAMVSVSIGDEAPMTQPVPFNQDIGIEVPVERRGAIPIAIEVEKATGEISTANNAAALSIAGARDRLRVMLVTGEPYAGGRAWRNLLKSDPSVDLVQFTILRSPEKQDFTPVEELALIPFPTRELFLDKIDSFDLVVFDRFKRLSVLPDEYLDSVAQWVENGGAFLMLAGPAESQSDGAYSTPLARVIPAEPSGKTINQAFRPILTDLGRRHPVSQGLADQSATWGQWLRLQASAPRGDVLLEGAGQPLLVLSQVGKGRAAALMSDQAWLWRRGYDGGGPFDELFRRTAHWLMKEADLEADKLLLRSALGKLLIEQQASTDPGPATIVAQSRQSLVALTAGPVGAWRGEMVVQEPGLYRVTSGPKSAFIVAGIGNPAEAQNLTANPEALAKPQAKAGGGAVAWLGRSGKGPLPAFTRIGKTTHASNGEIGLRKANASAVISTSREALLPSWAYMLAVFALALFGWWREGR